MNILAIIPARGGSKGIPRKNIRLIAGKPLIFYAMSNALNSTHNIDVIVTTDDFEISSFASTLGVDVVLRSENLSGDKVTLDPVVFHALNEREKLKNVKYDIVLTMQPTSPLLNYRTLDKAIDYFNEQNLDTLISAVNKPHLSWRQDSKTFKPNYIKRLNRQYLPKNLVEAGAFVIAKRKYIRENNRFGPNIGIFEISNLEGLDIDSAQDWWVCEKQLLQKNIMIRVEGYSEIGLGHIYRGLLLAQNLIEHNVIFAISKKSTLGLKKIKESNFPYVSFNQETEVYNLIKAFNCDIILNDILDTKLEYMQICKSTGVRVINFEDLGPGSVLADAVINDLYDKSNDFKNFYWGSEYYCLRDEFLLSRKAGFNEKAREVLVIFGGTDPSNLTRKIFDVAKKIQCKELHFTFVVGLGYEYYHDLKQESFTKKLDFKIVQDVKVITKYMAKADIAFCSQGRTMYELASLSVPTILLAQNDRETHHEFGSLRNGFLNLGLGTNVSEDTILRTLLWLIDSPEIRYQMKTQMMKIDLTKGVNRVKKIIFSNI